MPVDSYQEVASKYWNLIYKDAGGKVPNAKYTKEPFTLEDIDKEFENTKIFEFGHNAENLQFNQSTLTQPNESKITS